jgi:DNA-binding transcriptional regulator YiaG
MATVNEKHGKARTTRKTLSVRSARRLGAFAGHPQKVRKEYGLSLPLFARLLGIDEPTLVTWEKTGRMAKEAKAKVRRIAGLLEGLTRVMSKDELANWLTKPSDACRSAGENTPADLMAKGRYDKIEAMIYFFESGVAY